MIRHVVLFLLIFSGVSMMVPVFGRDVTIEAEMLKEPNGVPVRYGGDQSGRTIFIPRKYAAKQNEFRGIWISTVGNIDFRKHETALSFQADYRALVRKIKAAGFTAVIFQVRPSNDAFYPSKYNPWSRFLTGAEGKGFPGFDPLQFMISTTKRAGLEFHAWLNPYRVGMCERGQSLSQFLKTLSPGNFATIHPSLLLSIPAENGKHLVILNPGEPEVILFLSNTVRELIENYNMDAIHLDDYFYPYFEVGKKDLLSYRRYGKPKNMSLEDWRRSNVDLMVQTISSLIRQTNKTRQKNIRFGISPFGIWANKPLPTIRNKQAEQLYPGSTGGSPFGSLTSGSQSYYRQYADTRKWVRMKWVDYIIPQLYWSFRHPAAPYAALADWWADTVRGTGVDLYIGLAVYRQGVLPDWKDPNELSNQIKYTLLRPEIKGVSLFSGSKVFQPQNRSMKNAVQTVIRDYWNGEIR